MYIIATLLLIIGTLSGAIYGFMLEMPGLKIILYCFAGGFAGSAAGGLVFTYLYFTAPDDMNGEHMGSGDLNGDNLKKISGNEAIKRLEKDIQEMKKN